MQVDSVVMGGTPVINMKRGHKTLDLERVFVFVCCYCSRSGHVLVHACAGPLPCMTSPEHLQRGVSTHPSNSFEIGGTVCSAHTALEKKVLPSLPLWHVCSFTLDTDDSGKGRMLVASGMTTPLQSQDHQGLSADPHRDEGSVQNVT